jgi:hypothetical protein
VATSEPVVVHHGREGDGGGSRDEARPSASTACWTAVVFRSRRRRAMDAEQRADVCLSDRLWR